VNNHPRAMSLIVWDIGGIEASRWSLCEFAPAGYAAGFEGVRFTTKERVILNCDFSQDAR